MDANQQQPPLIKIKPDLDPFQVYGSNPEDQDDTSIAIQSTRVKLAALRAQDKVNDKSVNDDDEIF
jgi:hypothetical protein